METIVTKKWCNECKRVRPASRFGKDKSTKSGLYPYCKDCKNKRNSKHYQENKITILSRVVDAEAKRTKKRSYNLRKKYGIDISEYNRIYQAQQGKCAICGNWQRRLFVDHNHKNEEIRGLLCNNCNAGIGFLKESITVFEKAVAYLKGTLRKE
jgi:Autographiviridae endonuclease VII